MKDIIRIIYLSEKGTQRPQRLSDTGKSDMLICQCKQKIFKTLKTYVNVFDNREIEMCFSYIYEIQYHFSKQKFVRML